MRLISRDQGAACIQRVDEREILFARQDLFRYFGKGSAQYRQFYQDHPELLAYDEAISKKTPLGGMNPLDSPLFQSIFANLDQLGLESMVDGEPLCKRFDLSSSRAAEKVKAAARYYGAQLVGIGPLKQEWVYNHVGCTGGDREGFPKWGSEIHLEGHANAITMGFPMDLELLSSAPMLPALLGSAKAYAESAIAAVNLAAYIHRMGHHARAHHFSNYQVLAVPVAVDCGLGELSRAGYLLTREYGLGLRLSIVTTDMPLAIDRPADFGVQSFCRQCRRCAEECPAGAIPLGDKIIFNGVEKWKLDAQKCYAYWHVNGTDCGICMAVCPWTKPQSAFHKLNARLASIKGPHQGWMAWADQIVYGKHQAKDPPEFLG